MASLNEIVLGAIGDESGCELTGLPVFFKLSSKENESIVIFKT
jgi:hypothetical protein